MVGFILEVCEDEIEGDIIRNYELYFDLDSDCASFRILMSESEFKILKKLINEK